MREGREEVNLIGKSQVSAIRRFGSLGLEAKLLLSTQLLFNVGFYLVVPFLAAYMTEDLALGGALVGFIIGLRTFSQQGMFFVGGALADRFGIKPVLLTGIVIRILGFLATGHMTSVAGFMLGVVLIGFGAALFSPAVESRLAQLEPAERGDLSRSELFSLDALFLNIGSLVGPVLGALLIPFGFRLVSLLGAGIFGCIFLGHAFLVRGGEVKRAESLTAGMSSVVRNRMFIAFALTSCMGQVAYHLQYQAIPVELQRTGLPELVMGWIFAGISVYFVTAQMSINAWAERRPVREALAVGFGAQAFGFVIMAVAVVCPPLPGAWALLPIAVWLLIMHFGQMVSYPSSKDLVGIIAGEKNLGTYFGVYNSFGGFAVMVVSIGVGRLFDFATVTNPWAFLPWACLAALLAAAAMGVARVAGAVESRRVAGPAPKARRESAHL